MTLLDRLLQHDAWTTRQLLERSAGLSEEQLDQGFDLGRGALRTTFVHIIRNMEAWTDLMSGAQVRERGGESVPDLIGRLDRAASDLAGLARDIERTDAWDERWTDTLDDPPTTKTYGGAIAHVITHSMHHRAQALYMLRRLGIKDLPEGDVLSWERQATECSDRKN
jgi:uncharacterized damage-inducible protein DinB